MRMFPWMAGAALAAASLLAGCGHMATAPAPVAARPLACDDSIKAAFHPDAQTTVIAVRPIARGTQIVAVDSPQPITLTNDVCLVKLLVGPGATAEKDRTAKSYTQGIGMEIWLPSPASWNERIRNYGGGGWVGGGHRYPDQIGSKVPALVNANLGYATGTHDGGQPWYQDGSFAFLSDGRVNVESMHDMTTRSIYEQAVKTRALVELYYGRAPRYTYYDGHSQGGRQGLKAAQEWPQLYDGYLIGQPALSVPKFSLASLYPQVVMKSELGITALDHAAAAAFAKKVAAVNARAVASCDREHLGWLLDPFSCSYDPLRDAGALCVGVAGHGVAGSNADAATCMSAREAVALDKIWYGPTVDGSYDPDETPDGRSGRVVAARRLWWAYPRGSSIGGNITKASTDMLALALQDVRYAASPAASSGIPITNASTAERDRWKDLDYASYAQAFARAGTQPFLQEYMTDRPDLSRLRSLGRKMIVWNGLAEDVIPPAGAVNYYERVKALAGGDAATQSFLRMYMIPGLAHSSQGRPSTVGNRNNAVPVHGLPGNANQHPTAREQDLMFNALVDWVEHGVAPGTMVIRSRDGSTSYPVCVYPQKVTWNGSGSPREAASYACR